MPISYGLGNITSASFESYSSDATNDDLLVPFLRSEVQRLLEQGLSDAKIKEYLKNRYSEFILYRPEVNRATWFLWAAPVVLVLLGGLIVLRLSRRKNSGDSEQADSHVRSVDQQQRLDELLNSHKRGSE